MRLITRGRIVEESSLFIQAGYGAEGFLRSQLHTCMEAGHFCCKPHASDERNFKEIDSVLVR